MDNKISSKKLAVLVAETHCRLDADITNQWLEQKNYQYAAVKYAEEGCRHGHKHEHWRIWCALQSIMKVDIAVAITTIPIEGARWLAYWAHKNNKIDLYLFAFRYYLDSSSTGKVGTTAGCNSLYLSYLYKQSEFDDIISICDRYYKNNYAPVLAVYVYEIVWLVASLVATNNRRHEFEADALIKHSPTMPAVQAVYIISLLGRRDYDLAMSRWSKLKKEAVPSEIIELVKSQIMDVAR